mgnify:CR=1 FL=1
MDLWGKMGALGLLGITVPEAYGGQGGTLMDAVIAIEAVASVCPRSADVVQAGSFGAIRVLAEYGSKRQKEKYLKRLLTGEAVISVGMTEPEAGSVGQLDRDAAAGPRATARIARRTTRSPRTNATNKNNGNARIGNRGKPRSWASAPKAVRPAKD